MLTGEKYISENSGILSAAVQAVGTNERREINMSMYEAVMLEYETTYKPAKKSFNLPPYFQKNLKKFADKYGKKQSYLIEIGMHYFMHAVEKNPSLLSEYIGPPFSLFR